VLVRSQDQQKRSNSNTRSQQIIEALVALVVLDVIHIRLLHSAISRAIADLNTSNCDSSREIRDD
jgi:hypothetical protein